MGSLFSQYNPSTVYGEYNLRQKVYDNKKNIIIVLVFVLVVVLGAMVMIWSTSEDGKPYLIKKYDFHPPRYGNGPYGYGVYLPPANMINASL